METLSAAAEEKIGQIFDTKIKSFDIASATKADFQKINEMIVKANEQIAEQKGLIEKLSTQNDALQGVVNAQVTKTQQKNLTLEEAIYAAVEAKKAEVEAVIKGKQDKPLVFELRNTKAAVDMTTTTGTLTQTLTQNTGIISRIRHREERYLSVAAPGSIGANRALWVEEQDEQGIPVFIAEGTTKTKVSVKYVEQTAPVKKIAIYGKVTTEMLDDLPQFIS